MASAKGLGFGLIAFRDGLVDLPRFLDAYAQIREQPDLDLADALMSALAELDPAVRKRIEAEVERQLQPQESTLTLIPATRAPSPSPSSRPSLGETPSTLPLDGPPTLPPDAPPTLPPGGKGEGGGSGRPRSSQDVWGSRYQVERYHDKGGLGMIWVARDRVLDRSVALKEIRRDWLGHEESRHRFVREAKITSQLSHPGIVQVHDFGKRDDDDRPFYVMRFVGGETLQTVIRNYHANKLERGQDDPVAFRELLGTFVAICRTMAYAHQQGVIHRDLKPANVMVGEYGEVVVLDWGLAKRLGDASDLTGASSGATPFSGDSADNLTHGDLVGTPNYMPPEQAQGRNESVDALSDIYSLGATLFEILTGQNAWRGETQISAILARVVADPTPMARSRDGSIPPELDAICAKAMAKDREQRYAKADDLAEDVQRYLAREPVTAYPEPWPDRLRRWARKNRTLVATAAAVLVLLGAFAIYLVNDANARRADRIARGQTLAEAVLAANIGYVKNLVGDLADYRPFADPILKQAWTDKTTDPQRRLRAGLGLLPVDSALAPDLAEMLLRAAPEDLLVIRGFLFEHARSAALTDRFRRTLDDEKATDDERLRAAAALATFAPDDPRWSRHVETIAGPLVRENPLVMRSWSEAFQPIGDVLALPLASIFRDEGRSEAERINATNLIRDHARGPQGLAEVASWAEDEFFDLCVTRLASQAKDAVPRLEAILRRSPTPNWRDGAISWPALDSATASAIEQAHGLVAERFAFAQTLAGREVVRVCDAMGKAGYRPLKLRPYMDSSGEVRAAITWTRDGRSWRIAWGADRKSAETLDRQHQTAKLGPIDAMGWTENGAGARFAAVWGEGAASARIDWELSHAELAEMAAAEQPNAPRKEDSQSLAVWSDPDGESRYSAIWAPLGESKESSLYLWDGLEYEVQARLNEQSQWPMELALAPLSLSPLFEPNRIFQNPDGFPDRGRVYAGLWRNRPNIEARVVRGLTPADALEQARALAVEGWRPVSVAAMAEGSDAAIAQVWHRPIVPEAERLALALRQSRAATALARLGRSDLIWPLLKRSPDPTLRSQIIHDWARLKTEPRPLAERLKVEGDSDIRQALILALGEYEPETLRSIRSETGLDQWLLARYAADPHPGTHGGIDWLLRRRWGMSAALDDIDKSLTGQPAPTGRDWFMNGQGQTYIVVRGPVAFWMGSPLSEEGHLPEENRHWQRIDRSFAIAEREVTVRDYGRFLADNPDVADHRDDETFKTVAPNEDCPMVVVDWYDAARYCNWLSKKEGLPESEWCYPPEINKDDVRTKPLALRADVLERQGYRLPMETEWEYAYRGGSETRWLHGLSPQGLARQGWLLDNAKNQTRPAKLLRPNLLGAFDMAGNAFEWTNNGFEGRYEFDGSGKGRPCQAIAEQVEREDLRVLRGGSSGFAVTYLRGGNRSRDRTAHRFLYSGFRPARTYR